MTKVKVFKNNDIISKVEIKGHALSGAYGHDVVCAGISTVITGMCNALSELSDYNDDLIIMKEGYVAIPELYNDDKIQLMMNTLIVQLKTIKEVYSNYIEISYL